MNIGGAVGFVFEDDDWLSKLLLGAVISLIPVFGAAALTGYAIAVLRNVEAGSSRPLPSWDRIGEYFVDGVSFWVAILIYSLPLLVFLCPVALVWVLPALAGENQDLTTILSSIAGLVSAGLGCLIFLYALLLWLVTPVVQIRYAETGQLSACLRFGEVFRLLLKHLGAVIIAQVLVVIAGFVASTVLGSVIGALSVVPICGWVVGSLLGLIMVPAGVWLMLFAAHLYAQIGRQAAPSPTSI
jgi:hypothetical protein